MNIKRINSKQVKGLDLINIKQNVQGTLFNKEITITEFLKLIKHPEFNGSGNIIIEKNNLLIGSQPTLNLIEGTNVTLDIVNDLLNNKINLTINSTASGSSGGQVDSVIGGTGISVNNSDPINPIVNLNASEEDIKGTAVYDATLTGTENLDLSTFSSLYGILTGNTTITVSNTPSSGESFTRSLKIKSTTTETLTLPVTWKVIGNYVPDGSLYDFQIEFTNFPTVGLFVLCYINKIP